MQLRLVIARASAISANAPFTYLATHARLITIVDAGACYPNVWYTSLTA